MKAGFDLVLPLYDHVMTVQEELMSLPHHVMAEHDHVIVMHDHVNTVVVSKLPAGVARTGCVWKTRHTNGSWRLWLSIIIVALLDGLGKYHPSPVSKQLTTMNLL